MRALGSIALVVSLAALSACRPDILFGTYSCGPNADCPDGEVCDEATEICQAPGNASPFTCTPTVTAGSTLATAAPVTESACVSAPQIFGSCLGSAEPLDYFTFTTPAGCSDLALNAVIAFPLAYETLQISLTGADGASAIATDTDCADATSASGLTRCVSAPLDASTTYALRIEPVGSDDSDCGGDCAFNRYSLSLQLTTR